MQNIVSELTPLVAAGQYKQATIELQQYLKQHPTDHDAWLQLAEWAGLAGLAELQQQAQRQYELVAYFNHRLYLASQALQQRQFQHCREILDSMLSDVPGEFRALALYAELAMACGDYETATEIFETLHRHNFANTKTKHRAIQHMAKVKQFNKAIDIGKDIPLQQLLDAPDTALAMAQSYLKTAQIDQAERIYLQLQQDPRLRHFVLHLLGHLKTFAGDAEAAANYYLQALAVHEDKTESYWHLANLKTYRFNEQQSERMLQLLQSPLAPQEKMYLLFALAKMKEQKKQFAEACDYYQQANRLRYKAGNNVRVHDSKQLRTFFSQQQFSDRSTAPSGLIFILGMPRTGSTLLEQMLASHPEIDASHEISEISSIARLLESRKQDSSPYGLAQLSEAERHTLAQRYLDYVAPLRQQGRYLIDKLPANCNHIGLIKTLFPDAKIIETTRDPIATGWSLYRHIFAEGHLYANDLEEIGQYYLNYEQMMQFWRQQLGPQLLTIAYEDLLQAPEQHLLQITQYLKLDYHPDCLQFHQTQRSIQTPSAMQVRQPLYKTAMTDWQQVSEFLAPLIKKVESGQPTALS
ncbi:sulfotransferase [Rheinheimera sp.]|uniref:sulfotransferase n=1 Tax=Rheinheimera sp. TaxID=1869214 RepID=UPI00307D994E